MSVTSGYWKSRRHGGRLSHPKKNSKRNHAPVSLGGKSKVRLKVFDLEMRGIPIVQGGPKGGLIAVGQVVSPDSFIEFHMPKYCAVAESQREGMRVFIYVGETPGIFGYCSADENGDNSWELYARVSSECFHHFHREESGMDPLSGERMVSKPRTDVVEIGGRRFSLLNPGDASDLSFFAQIEFVSVGGWRVP